MKILIFIHILPIMHTGVNILIRMTERLYYDREIESIHDLHTYTIQIQKYKNGYMYDIKCLK